MKYIHQKPDSLVTLFGKRFMHHFRNGAKELGSDNPLWLDLILMAFIPIAPFFWVYFAIFRKDIYTN